MLKYEEFVEEAGEDRISAFPDCLLIEILFRLSSTKDAIRTGILSKRWKYLWTWVPTLIFTPSDHLPILRCQNPNSMSDFVSSLDKILTQCRPFKLKKFKVSISYNYRFESQFNSWIRYAISCNVEELDWEFWNGDEGAYLFDQSFYINSCLTDLRLSGCVLLNPSVEICWKNLRSLCITCGYLFEDMIENILSGSPLLETLELGRCSCFTKLHIASKSVKKLVFSGYSHQRDQYTYGDEIIKINAPNILSLTINGQLILGKLLLLNVSSVVEANLDYKNCGRGRGPREKSEEKMLKGFVISLRHVKELKIGESCHEVVSRLEAKGFDFPSNVTFF